MANPVKAGDAKPWVYAGYFQYDRQVAEEGKQSSIFWQPRLTGVVILPETGAKPNDKGKPGKTRGRKVTGLHSN